MDFHVLLIVAIAALVQIEGKNLDPGPKVLNESLNLPPQSSQKRYATKEIILYLTPSQIRALQEGRGLISPQNVPHTESDKHVQTPNHHDHLQQGLGDPQPLKSPPVHLAPVQEPHSDDFAPIIPPPEYRQSDNYAYLHFYPQNQPQDHKLVPFFPESQERKGPYKTKALIPQGPLHEKPLETSRDHLRDQWYHLLDQNRAQFHALAALSRQNVGKSIENNYSSKYGLDVDQLVRTNHKHESEHQHALLQAEAIANSPPVIVHKEINIKHSPVHLIKQVKIPVPTPILIPVPEPFEVKVPQPYPVPLEIIKQVPVPIVRTQKIEVEKHIPVEIEKHIPFPVTKSVYVEKPYFLDRGVPVEIPLQKSGSFPIHSHVWKH